MVLAHRTICVDAIAFSDLCLYTAAHLMSKIAMAVCAMFI